MDIEGLDIKKEIKILAVDDDETVSKLYWNILKEMGHKVIIATTGKEAIKMIHEEQYTLIMLDLVLPDIHGSELLKRVKDKIEDTPVVIITANPSLESSIEAIRAGSVYDYIIKPFDPEDLKMVIRRALEKVELTRDNKRLMKRLQTTNKALTERVEELEEFARQEVSYATRIKELERQIKKLKKGNS